MNRFLRLLCFATAAAFALLLARSGDAYGADAPPPRSTFALIVTNNKSPQLGRPDLHYADDDGVKYFDVFRAIAPDDNVHLLTELDRDSERLFPHMRGRTRPPTKAEVSAAAARIARAAGEARRAGAYVEFYFVFAGHGDVDGGKGFLELRDGRLTSDDVEALLKSIPAARSHVILDSCNSFFVLNARKPGGLRVAVTEEAARSLSARLPNVGVFLSTSAEAEVFEWSELQSGIFSHAVRSGLLGGADANQDGSVSYEELRAFVDIASSKVKNPLYRPKVFARAPGGRGSDAIFPLAKAKAVLVELDTAKETRLTVRDADDLPWIDLYKEGRARLTLRIPERISLRASVEEREVSEVGSRVVRRYVLESAPVEQPTRLASMTSAAPAPDARGPDDALRMLFAAPFGPRAMAGYMATSEKEREPVFGISLEDGERMRLMLEQISDVGKRRRLVGGGAVLGTGGLLLGTGLALQLTSKSAADQLWQVMTRGLVMVEGGAFIIGGGVGLLLRSEEEKLYDEFVAGLGSATPEGTLGVVARTEQRLFKMARKERKGRWTEGFFGSSLVLIGGAGLVLNETTLKSAFGNDPWPGRISYGLLTLGGCVNFISAFFPSPLERMADLWARDPGLRRMPRISFAPAPGGAMLGATGLF